MDNSILDLFSVYLKKDSDIAKLVYGNRDGNSLFHISNIILQNISLCFSNILLSKIISLNLVNIYLSIKQQNELVKIRKRLSDIVVEPIQTGLTQLKTGLEIGIKNKKEKVYKDKRLYSALENFDRAYTFTNNEEDKFFIILLKGFTSYQISGGKGESRIYFEELDVMIDGKIKDYELQLSKLALRLNDLKLKKNNYQPDELENTRLKYLNNSSFMGMALTEKNKEMRLLEFDIKKIEKEYSFIEEKIQQSRNTLIIIQDFIKECNKK